MVFRTSPVRVSPWTEVTFSAEIAPVESWYCPLHSNAAESSTSTQNFNFNPKLQLPRKTSTSTQHLNFGPKLKLGPKMKTLDAASVKELQYFCLGITAPDRPCIARSDAVICERKDSFVLTDDASRFWPISQVLVLGRSWSLGSKFKFWVEV